MRYNNRKSLFRFLFGFDFFSSWISVAEIRELFPRCRQIEFTELLSQFQWFTNHSLFFIIISELKIGETE